MKERLRQILDPFRINSEKKPRLWLFILAMVLLGYFVYTITGNIIKLLTNGMSDQQFLISFLIRPFRYLLYTGIIVPILETLVMQMLPIEIMRRFRIPAWIIIVITGFLFSIGHLIRYPYSYIITISMYLPFGLILAYSYIRFRSLSLFQSFGVTALIHGLINTIFVSLIAILIWFAASDKNINPINARRVLALSNCEYNERTFFYFLNYDCKPIINLYLAAGMNPNIKNEQGWFPLMYAASGNESMLIYSLLEKGADVNAYDTYGRTALIIAASKGYSDNVLALLKNGANINMKTDGSYTALMFAAANGHTDIVQLLLAKGADVNAKDSEGKTALMYASAKNYTEIVQLLKQAGAKD
jgi:membrane protease YdiL (CAAX protease family)